MSCLYIQKMLFIQKNAFFICIFKKGTELFMKGNELFIYKVMRFSYKEIGYS